MLRLFAPRQSRKHAHSLVHTIAAILLNGDWRGATITHCCGTCCSEQGDTLEAVRATIPKMLHSLRYKMLSRADWSEWQDALALIGLLGGMHRMFSRCFIKAFSGSVEPELPEAVANAEQAESDGAARFRTELNSNTKAALAFWESQAEWKVEVLVDALSAQRVAMHELLRLGSIEYEQLQREQMLSEGHTTFTSLSNNQTCRKKSTFPFKGGVFFWKHKATNHQ